MATQATTHGVIVETMIEVIAVSIVAIIADSSEGFGKVAVAVMIGWLLLWAMSSVGSNFIATQTKRLGG